MEQAKTNRLQFVHHDSIFQTNEEAINFVKNGQAIDRPSLYAEPMILKYGEESDPNIILAIGTVGDGTTQSLNNRTFFIDFAEHSKQINKLIDEVIEISGKTDGLQELVDKVIESCGLNEDGSYKKSEYTVIKNANTISESIDLLAKYVESHHLKTKETDTIKLTITCDDNEQDLIEGTLKLKENIVVDRTQFSNQIAVYEDGIFYNVSMEYAGNGNPLYLLINGEKAFSADIPTEIHAIGGDYSTDTESLIIKMSDGTDFSINLKKLIAEWIVLGEDSKTPIVLTRQEVSGDSGASIRVETWQDVLSADVRLHNGDNNILVKSDKGTTLYVNGVASNIKTTKSDVQTELDIINGGDDVEGSIKQAVKVETDRAKEAEHELKISVHTLSAETYEKFHEVEDDLNMLTINVKTFSGKVEHDLADERKIRSEADAQLTDNLLAETEARIDGDSKLNSKFDALSGAVKTEINLRETSDTALSDRINTINVIYKEGSNSIEFTDDQGNVHNYQLNAGSIIDSMYYDSTKEAIIIIYTDTSKVSHTVEVPVRGLLNEWDVDNNNATVTLTKTISTSAGVDKLKANVNIANSSTNMIENVGNALYVSNTGITKNANDIATLDGKVDAEIARAKAAEAQALADAKEYTDDSVLAETNRAKAAELANKTLIDQLSGKVDAEISRSTLKDESLSTDIANNSAAIAKLQTDLTKEISDRKESDTNIKNSLQSDLVDEIHRATAAETKNANDILTEIANRENAIETVTTALETETNRATAAENTLNTKVTKNATDIAELDNVLTTEINRAKTAENTLGTAIITEENRATLAEQAINAKITANEVKIKSNEDAIGALQTKVDADSDRILNLENETATLSTDLDKLEEDVAKAISEVKSNKIVTNNSGSLILNETIGTTGTTIVGYTNVSTSTDNIIIGGNSVDGAALFASVDIEYNGATNVMTLKKSNGVNKEITLNAGSVIEDIYYKNQELVILYKTSGGVEKTVSVPVADFFKEMVVDNTDGAVDITITKNAAGQWVFSASADVAESPKQALKKVDNTLFVSNQASDYYLTDGRTVQKGIDDLKDADANLLTKINNEVTRATNAEQNLQLNIDAVNAIATTNKNDITTLKDKVNNHETRITILEGKVDANAQNIQQNSEAIDNLTTAVTKNTTDIANLKTKVDKNTTDIANLNTKVDNLTTAVTQNTTDIANLKTKVDKNTTDITNLNTKVANNTTKIDLLQNTVDGLGDRITIAEGDIVNINQELNGLDDRFVHVTGDTMTGALNINSYLRVTDNATVGTLTSNGNATVNGTITATNAVYSSDKNLKENIDKITDAAIDKVKNIQLKEYSFIADNTHTTKYGVIAQDVESVGLENLVTETENGTKGIDYISFLILKIAQLEKEIAELKK